MIAIPDDFPAVMGASAAYRRLVSETPIAYFDTLPGSDAALVERIRECEFAINIRASTKFTAGVFASCPKLKLLSIWGTGTDNVDLAAAAKHGVTVVNTPGVAAPAIAEHALMLMLAVARRVVALHGSIVAGEWTRGQSLLLQGNTLGIIGLGAIGRQFARLGQGIGMRVIAWTMHPNPDLGFELVDLDTLLRTSDVVSVHLRASNESAGFLGRTQFERMKSGAILINTARGPIVDESALLEALRTGQLGGAGLDVFDVEPLRTGHPLTRAANVVLTPHCAGIAPEILEAGLALAIENIKKFAAGTPQNVVTAGPVVLA